MYADEHARSGGARQQTERHLAADVEVLGYSWQPMPASNSGMSYRAMRCSAEASTSFRVARVPAV